MINILDCKITPELVASHGMKPEEYDQLLVMLNREPTITELGIFSVMWSEHCSYKSSRVLLKTLPTEGSCVIQGPGENAGVVDIGDGDCIVFKMESHNHPSYIEPFQGAATGVGGIMRDIFTMGARPIANLNALRFGDPKHPETRRLLSGVVAGIANYGNSVGVPTVGGETDFDSAYNNNILVNVMCIGLAKTEKIFYSAAKGTGLPVIYVGSKTGRDGIHGATMASKEFSFDSQEKLATVQVGDPFAEKLLIEACLELMAGDVILAIQDMGAAGLTSSTSEMADKGGVGIELNLDNVPQRESDMTAYEMMLSESQERMLMVLKPGCESSAEKIFKKWGLDFAIIGYTTDSDRLVVKHNGEVHADIPVAMLVKAAPLYKRPWIETSKPEFIPTSTISTPSNTIESLKLILSHPQGCSRRWIWEQYDHMVMGDTLSRPGGDAAVVRVHGRDKAVAACCDVTPRYVLADPYMGTKQAVAECWRNLISVGADPLAITNNLNFGSPERKDIMGQIVSSVSGMGEACRALDFPVVSGNVSLYNETENQAIPPTPTVGGLGVLRRIDHMVNLAFKEEGNVILLLGPETGHLNQSLYQQIIIGSLSGEPPPIDLLEERRTGDFVRKLINSKKVFAVHDVSDGGLLVSISEMSLAGGKGANLLEYNGNLSTQGVWFGEDQSRYIIEISSVDSHAIIKSAEEAGVKSRVIGHVCGLTLMVGNEKIALEELRMVHEKWFSEYMN
ncbi:MAG: phosphoribosylformylglycinamidine synthase subunit PurL [Hyphomicrobiaceae bacterium]|nr:phosphoribosylformylglycinamidine synthase subunit PurL [Hyphomicrobiaceae bacterium]